MGFGSDRGVVAGSSGRLAVVAASLRGVSEKAAVRIVEAAAVKAASLPHFSHRAIRHRCLPVAHRALLTHGHRRRIDRRAESLCTTHRVRRGVQRTCPPPRLRSRRRVGPSMRVVLKWRASTASRQCGLLAHRAAATLCRRGRDGT